MDKGHPGYFKSMIDAKLQEQGFFASQHCVNCGHELDYKPTIKGLHHRHEEEEKDPRRE
uniref:Uncharacterized protein n=1 Tax=Aegilops tauschii TaxID=37682 RepID=N1QUY7_AEGTA